VQYILVKAEGKKTFTTRDALWYCDFRWWLVARNEATWLRKDFTHIIILTTNGYTLFPTSKTSSCCENIMFYVTVNSSVQPTSAVRLCQLIEYITVHTSLNSPQILVILINVYLSFLLMDTGQWTPRLAHPNTVHCRVPSSNARHNGTSWQPRYKNI